jgi:carbon-monoxide dehydrogenase medium subunit
MLSGRIPNAKPLAGGTNVVVELRDGHHAGKTLVDISRIRELRGIHRQNGHVVIGGGTTITDLFTDPVIASQAPLLRECAAVFANPLVRNRATVGGNLVDASPAADTAPPLLALDAEVELASERGSRWVRLEDFIVGVRKTLLQPDELLVSIRWPDPAPRTGCGYTKIGLRKADAISVISIAVLLTLDESGTCEQARIAMGAVAPRPIMARLAESTLQGNPVTPDRIQAAAHLAAQEARPISDIRGTIEYRKRVIEVTVRRLLTTALEAARKV